MLRLMRSPSSHDSITWSQRDRGRQAWGVRRYEPVAVCIVATTSAGAAVAAAAAAARVQVRAQGTGLRPPPLLRTVNRSPTGISVLARIVW